MGFPNTDNELIFQGHSGTVFRRCSSKYMFLKFSESSQEIPLLDSLINKVADLQACNFIKKRLQHGRILAKLAKFLQGTCGDCFCELVFMRSYMEVLIFVIW